MRHRLITLLLLFLLSSCEKIQQYPDIPVVTFKSFDYSEKSLVINFVDGDGDFGFRAIELSEKDTIDSVYNVFAPMEEKINGVYYPIEVKTGWKYRVTDIPIPQGQNKTLKGEIKLRYNWMTTEQFPDTFRFKFWIVDSVYHQSNVDSTPDLYKALLIP